ncbi:MAG: helix-turn-helix transcriptional regulator [Chitinophagaceae bacterium]|nr:helix-turn-helix transcriptional regulator [Chitinophagaceae bacterium]
MDADIHTLYKSDFYRVLDFRCRCTDCRESKPEHGEAFCISFVRKGNFLFNVFRRQLDSYTGCVLICKPEYERTITHTHVVPDQCTIFEFEKDFYRQLKERYGGSGFFGDNDWHSALVRTDADIEYLHYSVLRMATSGHGVKLLIDQLVMQIIAGTLGAIIEYRPDVRINGRLKQQHLATIETAKDYIAGNFTRDLSLMEISNHCCVSPFHFSRLFKIFTNTSPHQYLLSIRLQHAAMLLGNSDRPVADIAFTSGFNGVEHFTAAFRKKYKFPPARWREAPGK